MSIGNIDNRQIVVTNPLFQPVVPLEFYFCRSNKLSLPIIALKSEYGIPETRELVRFLRLKYAYTLDGITVYKKNNDNYNDDDYDYDYNKYDDDNYQCVYTECDDEEE